MNWSTFIRQRRLELDLTQVQLAAKTGIPQSYISHWENGSVPSTKFLGRLMVGLEITPDELASLLDGEAA